MKKYTAYILTTSLLWLSSCENSKKIQETDNTSSCVLTPEFKKLVKLETLSVNTINKEIDLTGSVSYDQDHIFRYQSLASGIIQKVYFNIGDYVEKGQVLAEVRTTELSGQKSELIKAESELKIAKRKLTATQNLYKDGVASDKDLLEDQRNAMGAQSEINRINETLMIQGGDLGKNRLVIRAPLSGYVVEKKITTGYQVDAGEDDLFVISDLKKVWVMANIYSAQLGMVKVGQKVTIRTTAYPDRIFEGKINRLSNIFDPEERVLKAIIEINNDGLLLKPSMMVSVNVYQPSEQQGISIPAGAVVFLENTYYLLKYKNDCDIRAVSIAPVAKDARFYYINEGGDFKAGDTIVSQNQLLLYNKLRER